MSCDFCKRNGSNNTRTPLVVGGEEMPCEGLTATTCTHFKGIVVNEKTRAHTHCLCGLKVEDGGKLERSRCNKTCPHYDEDKRYIY